MHAHYNSILLPKAFITSGTKKISHKPMVKPSIVPRAPGSGRRLVALGGPALLALMLMRRRRRVVPAAAATVTVVMVVVVVVVVQCLPTARRPSVSLVLLAGHGRPPHGRIIHVLPQSVARRKAWGRASFLVPFSSVWRQRNVQARVWCGGHGRPPVVHGRRSRGAEVVPWRGWAFFVGHCCDGSGRAREGTVYWLEHEVCVLLLEGFLETDELKGLFEVGKLIQAHVLQLRLGGWVRGWVGRCVGGWVGKWTYLVPQDLCVSLAQQTMHVLDGNVGADAQRLFEFGA